MEINTYLKSLVQTALSYEKPIDKIYLFGSRARGDFKETSDIDIAILSEDWSHLDISRLHDYVENEIKTLLKWDIVHFNSLDNETFKQKILDEGKVIYDARENETTSC